MKILLAIPGHLKTVPMGRYSAEALTALGHEVTVFDFRSGFVDKMLDRFGGAEPKSAMNRRLRRLAEALRPDLFLTIFGFDLSPRTLAHLRALAIPTACWWLNDPFQFDRSLARAAEYDFLFSNASGSVDQYRRAGVAQAHYLPTACDPSVHRPVAPDDALRCEIVFAGDWSPLRERIVGLLARDFAVRVFGPWRRKLAADSPLPPLLTDGFFTPDAMARMFASADLVLNVHTWFETWDYGLNPRVFEAAGCGACQLVDWKRDIGEVLVDGEEMRTWRRIEDIAGYAREILSASGLSRQMGARAHRRAHGEHTYRHRMERLLSIAGGAPGDA